MVPFGSYFLLENSFLEKEKKLPVTQSKGPFTQATFAAI